MRLGSGAKLLSSALADFILKMSCPRGGGQANPEAAGEEGPLSPWDPSDILQLLFFRIGSEGHLWTTRRGQEDGAL